MAFRFTLAQVLRVRESIERKEELALQRAELELARVRSRIEELTAKLAHDAGERETAMQRPVKAIELQAMEAARNETRETIRVLGDTLQGLTARRDAQRKIYQAAHNGRRMLSDLEQEQKNEWLQEQERKQQKRLDDIFAARMKRDLSERQSGVH